MKTDWIFDVLSDLRLFAQENGLPVLGEHLDDARIIAATEIASRRARGRAVQSRSPEEGD